MKLAVTVDAGGQPTYTIATNVAYDYLAEESRLVSLARQARALCFGTLIQRQLPARNTVQRLLRSAVNALIVSGSLG